MLRNDSLEKVRNLLDWAREINIFGYKPHRAIPARTQGRPGRVDIKALKDNNALKRQLANLADQVAAVAAKTGDASTISGNYRRRIDLS